MSMAALRGKLDCCCCCCSCFSGDPFYKSDLNNCFPVLVSPVFSGGEKKGFASIISFLQEKKEEKKINFSKMITCLSGLLKIFDNFLLI